MVVVLSGFNGIENVVEELYSAMDSDIKISPVKGKYIRLSEFPEKKLSNINGIKYQVNVYEEMALVQHEDKSTLAVLKGVEEDYLKMNKLKNYIKEGNYTLYDEEIPLAIIGSGLLMQLNGYIHSPTNPDKYERLKVVMVKGGKQLIKQKEDAKRTGFIEVGSRFAVNAQYNDRYMIVPLSFMHGLMDTTKETLTSIELQLDEEVDKEEIEHKIQSLLGKNYKVENLYEQNALIFQTNESEKWIVFLILCLIFIISTFNMVASLSMLILDKQKDIKTLSSMGAEDGSIKSVFIWEGMLINFVGSFLGILLGLVLCWGQISFGWIGMGENAVVDQFPVEIEWMDMVYIFLAIFGVGLLVVYLPVRWLIGKKLGTIV